MLALLFWSTNKSVDTLAHDTGNAIDVIGALRVGTKKVVHFFGKMGEHVYQVQSMCFTGCHEYQY